MIFGRKSPEKSAGPPVPEFFDLTEAKDTIMRAFDEGVSYSSRPVVPISGSDSEKILAQRNSKDFQPIKVEGDQFWVSENPFTDFELANGSPLDTRGIIRGLNVAVRQLAEADLRLSMLAPSYKVLLWYEAGSQYGLHQDSVPLRLLLEYAGEATQLRRPLGGSNAEVEKHRTFPGGLTAIVGLDRGYTPYHGVEDVSDSGRLAQQVTYL